MPSPEQFIRVWNQSSSASEVARKLKMTRLSALSRASRYRKQGIQLKAMPKGRPATLKFLAENQ